MGESKEKRVRKGKGERSRKRLRKSLRKERGHEGGRGDVNGRGAKIKDKGKSSKGHRLRV